MQSHLRALFALMLMAVLNGLAAAQSAQLWSTFHSLESDTKENAVLMARGPDGSYYTAAYVGSRGMEVSRFSSDGQQLWVRWFDGIPKGIAADASGVVITGRSVREAYNYYSVDGVLLRFDLSGNLSKPVFSQGGAFGDVALAANGDAVIATTGMLGQQAAGYTRYSPAGALVSSKVYVTDNQATAQGIIVSSNGITLLGTSIQGRFVAQYGPSGTLVWDRVVPKAGLSDLDYKMDATGALYVLYPFAGNDDYWARVLKFDSAGTLLYDTQVPYATRFALGPSGQVGIARTKSSVLQLSPDGAIQWDQNPDGFDGTAEAMAYDEAGNLYYSGSSSKWPVYTAFIARVSPSGEREWIQEDPALNLSDAKALSYLNGAVVTFANAGAGESADRLALLKVDSAGKMVWRTENGPAQAREHVLDSAVDSAGNVYLAGVSESFPYPYHQGFLEKVGPDGVIQWTRRYGGGAFNVQLHPGGGVVTEGYGAGVAVSRYSASGQLLWEYQGSDFSPSVPDFNQMAVSAHPLLVVDSAGNSYVFGTGNGILARKLSPSGAVLWTGTWPGHSGAILKPVNIAVAPNGSVYVSVRLEADYWVNTTLLKFSPTGAFHWERIYKNFSYPSSPLALATDAASNVYVGGTESNGTFVWKLHTDGSPAYLKVLPSSVGMAAMALDPSGNIFAAGQSRNGVTLFKMNASFVPQWSRTWTDPAATYSSVSRMIFDAAGTVILGGTTWSPRGSTDAFVLRYSNDQGDILWPDSGDVFRNGAVVFDGGWGLQDTVAGIGIDSNGNVYMGGSSAGPSGTQDIHAAKYSTTASRPAIDSAFVRQSVDTTMATEQLYTATVAFRNAGSTPWTKASGFKLVSMNPYLNTTWGQSSVPLADGEVIRPGESKVFTFSFNAPSTAGTYNFRWRMFQEGIGTFGPASGNVVVQVIKRQHAARFISQTVPTNVTVGAPFTVQVTMKNVGTNTWTAGGGYALTPAPGSPAWGVTFVHLSPNETIPPGGQKTFTFSCTAPAYQGSYTLRWRMHRSSNAWAGYFGDQTPGAAVAVSP